MWRGTFISGYKGVAGIRLIPLLRTTTKQEKYCEKAWESNQGRQYLRGQGVKVEENALKFCVQFPLK